MVKPRDDVNWEALKAEYLDGASINSLSKKYDVSRNAIISRGAKQHWIEASPYKKHIPKEIRQAEGIARAAIKRNTGKPRHDRRRLVTQMLVDESRWMASLVDEQLKAAIRHYARTHRLGETLERVLNLIESWLTGTDEERAEAAKVLFASQSDTLIGHIKMIVGAYSELQRLERETLGIRSQPANNEVKVGIQLNGPPIEIKELSDDALIQLRDIADGLDRQRPASAQD
jgi:hypothetical protein